MSGHDTAKHDTAAARAQARGAAAGDEVRAAADSATDAAALTYEEVRDQLEALKDDLGGLAEAARAAGVQTARRAYGSARRAGGRAVEAAEDGYGMANERMDDARAGAEDFVRARPVAALGLAAGGGFLLAMYLSRR